MQLFLKLIQRLNAALAYISALSHKRATIVDRRLVAINRITQTLTQTSAFLQIEAALHHSGVSVLVAINCSLIQCHGTINCQSWIMSAH
jgi:hypothetical protein